MAAGYPHPDLEKAVKDEHCEMFGFNREFVTGNYNVQTTPCQEYKIVMGKRECPELAMLDKKGNSVRVIRRIEELKETPLVRKAKLVEIEIAAVVRHPLRAALRRAFMLTWPRRLRTRRAAIGAACVG